MESSIAISGTPAEDAVNIKLGELAGDVSDLDARRGDNGGVK